MTATPAVVRGRLYDEDPPRQSGAFGQQESPGWGPNLRGAPSSIEVDTPQVSRSRSKRPEGARSAPTPRDGARVARRMIVREVLAWAGRAPC